MENIMAKGFLVGLAYLAPIGMQNLYVIQAGLTQSKRRTYFIVITTVFFDILLALAGFLGMGLLIERFEGAKILLLLFGGMLIIWIGISIIKSKPNLETQSVTYGNRLQIIVACFLVTWANPQAILDSTLLFGGFRASLSKEMAYFFVLGSALASMTWFFTIGTVAHLFKFFFQQKILRIINGICGVVLLYYGFHLIKQALLLL